MKISADLCLKMINVRLPAIAKLHNVYSAGGCEETVNMGMAIPGLDRTVKCKQLTSSLAYWPC